MAIVTLVRIRWQETWGDQSGGALEDTYTHDEAEGLLPGLVADWFPEGFGLERDQDSPNAWAASGTDSRKVWFFLEPVGG